LDAGVPGDGAIAFTRCQKLLGHERVAPAAPDDLVHELRVRCLVEDCPDRGGAGSGGEALELDPFDERQANDLRDPWQERVTAGELVAAGSGKDSPRHAPIAE